MTKISLWDVDGDLWTGREAPEEYAEHAVEIALHTAPDGRYAVWTDDGGDGYAELYAITDGEARHIGRSENVRSVPLDPRNSCDPHAVIATCEVLIACEIEGWIGCFVVEKIVEENTQ